ncbi:hypothetical protein [Streptomyces sp. NPDC017529]|uniref:hypothetical protein n=1 Tax=Streptomyces sp. NPDC017529 TaxID=3365000 RepID=UPI00379586EC
MADIIQIRAKIDTAVLDHYPAYLRAEDTEDPHGWCLERARVTVRAADSSGYKFDNHRLEKIAENRRIWLHEKYGKQLLLHRAVERAGTP